MEDKRINQFYPQHWTNSAGANSSQAVSSGDGRLSVSDGRERLEAIAATNSSNVQKSWTFLEMQISIEQHHWGRVVGMPVMGERGWTRLQSQRWTNSADSSQPVSSGEDLWGALDGRERNDCNHNVGPSLQIPVNQSLQEIILGMPWMGEKELIAITTEDLHQSGVLRECRVERSTSSFEGSNARDLGISGILSLGNFGTRITSSPELWISKSSKSIVLEILGFVFRCFQDLVSRNFQISCIGDFLVRNRTLQNPGLVPDGLRITKYFALDLVGVKNLFLSFLTFK
ncbi:uncharacterized protein LOC112905389 [Agrilus planipennis]|uniref:Uncharacterized protein LOC112905389 n=1 Tax=Agrilus planipennis TaxID=224129 RepID=A0A7F5RBZ6_AGRPL|nr:uncharacterized protein LOC112905389 [Agrilus planipennis]